MSSDAVPQNPTTEIPKLYDPQAAQAQWFPYWEQHGYFNADPGTVGRDGQPKKPHTIMIPLPNVTGALHMGHALNGTCQDLITRWKRMQGYEALWMPGTDHAGIATQAVVERRMQEEEGLTRHDIGREALVTRIWKWKDAFEARIISQLKLLGFSCDWRRQRFTLDDVCSKAVRRTFFKMFQDGYIFRGKRLVNWDCFLQTAVADDEVYDEEIDGHFWTFSYPVVEETSEVCDLQFVFAPTGEAIHFSTTRPETMLGDTAVCVHPTDERYMHLIGKYVRIPVNGRRIPIIADALLADKTLGTGCVKVTPAHDPNDYACWNRNKDKMGEPINILNPDGTINENGQTAASAGRKSAVPATDHADPARRTYVRRSLDFSGLDRLVAREHVIEEMQHLGHFEAVEDRKIPMKHSDRSKTPIEPYLSEQWFVKMDDWSDGRPGLAQTALDAVNDGRVKFFPMRYTKTYLDWLGEKRDWCISRQLWWGHRVPVWSFSTGVHTLNDLTQLRELEETGRISQGLRSPSLEEVVTSTVPDKLHSICVRQESDHEAIRAIEAMGFVQDLDVLDTWFSSALWPLSTLGWPGTDAEQAAGGPDLLRAFNPTSTLCTAREIITLWVSRMVMFNRYFFGEAMGKGPVPFRDVFIHAVIQDGQGQKMSKSLGNGVDPLDIIATHGADALRFTLCHMATETQDVRMPVDLICPHTSEVFPPKMIQNKDGYTVPTPIQTSPKDPAKKMVTGYGVASGEAKATADMPLARNTSSKFDLGRNFANKLWNATRFALSMLEANGKQESNQTNKQSASATTPIDVKSLAMVDRWMLSRVATQVRTAEAALTSYQFADHATALYDLAWRDFCDWYLEAIKPTVGASTAQRAVLAHALEAIVRALHPTMPYVTEVIFERLRTIKTAPIQGVTMIASRKANLLCSAGWPEFGDALIDPAAELAFDRVRTLVTAIREVRAQYNVPPKRQITLHLPDVKQAAAVEDGVGDDAAHALVRTLAGVGTITTQAAKISVAFAFDGAEWRLSDLTDAVDAASERTRLTKAIADLDKSIATLDGRLSNPGYADKAPAHMVQQTRDQLNKAKAERDAAKNTLEQFA